MRDWGVVGADELQRAVVVSPHMDDAVLGLGQLLAANPGVTVVTVFAGRPAAYPEPMTRWDQLAGFKPGDDVIAARRDEDTKALTELDAIPVWLDHVEHQYLPREEWVQADAVAETVQELALVAAHVEDLRTLRDPGTGLAGTPVLQQAIDKAHGVSLS